MSYALQQAQHFPRRESATKKKEFIGSGKDCTNTNRSSSNHAYDLRPAQKAEAQRAYISSPLQATNDGLKKKKTRQNQSADRKLFLPIYGSNQYLSIFNRLILASSNSMRKKPLRTPSDIYQRELLAYIYNLPYILLNISFTLSYK